MNFAQLVDWKLPAGTESEVHGTTVIAVRYDQGVLILADRRATMGSLIMFDQAEKIEALDPTTVLAISGAYARSLEVCRFLRHSFKFYERMNLQPLSTEGKLMEISRALSGNLPAAASGGGLFIPIAGIYDQRNNRFSVYFFDAAGARFQDSDYACAGSGSERIRGAFEYIIRTVGPWNLMPREQALKEALRLLDIAAQLDSATGGFSRHLPMVRDLTRSGSEFLSDQEIEAARI